jgi:putative Holliday junction resolvase
MAMRSMIEGGVKKGNRQDKSMIDRISASIILQSWLDSMLNRKSEIKL